MTEKTIRVGIIMGSDSDWPKIHGVADALDEFNVGYEIHVMSAHRTPDKVLEYASSARSRGLGVIIAAAGGRGAPRGRRRVAHDASGRRYSGEDGRHGRPRFAPFHRPNARRRSCRDGWRRFRRRAQRGASRSSNSRDRRSRACGRARRI